MRPDEDQLGDYKAAMENLRNADRCDSCGKPIEPGAGFTISTKKDGKQNFHKDANACANAPEVKKPGQNSVRHTPNYRATRANQFRIDGDLRGY